MISSPIKLRDDCGRSPLQAKRRFSTNQITDRIIGSAITIHRRLGPGLLEAAYESCLAYELNLQGLVVVQQKAVPLIYEHVKLECGFRADLLVENPGRRGIEMQRTDSSSRRSPVVVPPETPSIASGTAHQLSCGAAKGRNTTDGERLQRAGIPRTGGFLTFVMSSVLRVLCGPSQRPLRFKIFHGTQSAINTFVSCGTLALRPEIQTSLLPSGLNIGKPSKPSV
jgi:PD-(D/E)XK nuclease superfamily